MRKILDELRAKGVSAEAIGEIEKWAADFERRRELNRRTQADYRRRKADVRLTPQVIEKPQPDKADVRLTVDPSYSKGLIVDQVSRALPSEGPLEISLVAPAAEPKTKTKRAKPVKTTLPDDWQPKGPQRDPTEADEFRDSARANGRMYADWHAAYRKYQQHPEYNHRNKPGWQPPAAPVLLPGVVETSAQRWARIEALRLKTLEEAGHGEATEATGIWENPGMGPQGRRDAPKLRLAGGISHGEQHEAGHPLFAYAGKGGRG